MTPAHAARTWTFFGWRRQLAAALLCAYLTFLRCRNISDTFELLGDQILYWKIALLPALQLPIGGGPTSIGGTTIGPVFFWVLWGIRKVVGPFTSNLPHAGGIGLAAIQSAADGFLFAALWTRTQSFFLAIAVVLFLATSPFDMSLSASIWNPPLAVALVKCTIAFLLLDGIAPADVWVAGAAASGILAVQAHSSAIFVTAPAVAAAIVSRLRVNPIRPVLREDGGLVVGFAFRDWKPALWRAGLVAAVVFVLELPYLADLLRHPEKNRSPATVVTNVSYTLGHPLSLRAADAARYVASAGDYILLWPASFRWFGMALGLAAAVVTWTRRRDAILIGATTAPLLCAAAGFALWQGGFDNYWLLVVMPSMALTLALAMTAWTRAAPSIALILALVVVATHQSRAASSMRINRLPEYGALVTGSREIRRLAPEVRAIETEFTLPPSTDVNFLYEVLGGRVDPAGRFVARITQTGGVVFRSDRATSTPP